MTDSNDIINQELEAFELEGDFILSLENALKCSHLFNSLPQDNYSKIASHATAIHLDKGDVLMKKGEIADSFYIVTKGEVSILSGVAGEKGIVANIGVNESIGEMGILLNKSRSATVVAATPTICAKFSKDVFSHLFSNLPGFGLAIAKYMAQRLEDTSWKRTHKDFREDATMPGEETFSLLPIDFIQRHRVMPLRVEGNHVTLGITEEVSNSILIRVEGLLSGMEVIPVCMDQRLFAKIIRHYTSTPASSTDVKPPPLQQVAPSPQLVSLLKRMVEEGASDLHLSANHRPRWRVDGQIKELHDQKYLGREEVLSLLKPVMRPETLDEFKSANDCDYSYALEGVARFRINMFRDRYGTSAVLRMIPMNILSLEQIGLPNIVRTLCSSNNGLILITGPTGSGKSTTLASMVDHINRNFPLHILTMEDPIEFVHESIKCLVNQREIGHHSTSFSAALRASLREDPDIVLVGELRDRETVELALELANTGHLVLGTLHTSTAVSTIDRIVDLFPTDQHNQVRSGLADSIQGIIAQTLCRKIGGGRIAALEILINSYAMANLIREGKSAQIYNTMLTGKKLGNTLLNDELAQLVVKGKISAGEAMSRAVDKVALKKNYPFMSNLHPRSKLRSGLMLFNDQPPFS
jgi:pilus retraction protein PilT